MEVKVRAVTVQGYHKAAVVSANLSPCICQGSAELSRAFGGVPADDVSFS